MAAQKCPQCGSNSVKCYHITRTAIEYYDEYTFKCLSCGYMERDCYPAGDNVSTNCPYCGIERYYHDKLPKELDTD